LYEPVVLSARAAWPVATLLEPSVLEWLAKLPAARLLEPEVIPGIVAWPSPTLWLPVRNGEKGLGPAPMLRLASL
jgi:hypothetical protein